MTPPVKKPPTEPKPPDEDRDDADGGAKREDDPYYCPGCGRRYRFLTECRGQNAAAPHPPILVVSTDELDGDAEDHTPAPPGGDQG